MVLYQRLLQALENIDLEPLDIDLDDVRDRAFAGGNQAVAGIGLDADRKLKSVMAVSLVLPFRN